MAAAMATQVFRLTKDRRMNQDDKSRKKEFDHPIQNMIDRINAHENYFTTSSCSGRIVVFSNNAENIEKTVKKGFTWLLVSHEEVTSESVEENINKSTESTILKFEPFILHVRCSNLPAAQNLMVVCVGSGYRNSGLTIGKKGNITLAVRSATSFEVPLSHNGESLVTKKYIEYIVDIANQKMRDNLLRIQRLEENLTNFLSDVKIQDEMEDSDEVTNCEHKT